MKKIIVYSLFCLILSTEVMAAKKAKKIDASPSQEGSCKYYLHDRSGGDRLVEGGSEVSSGSSYMRGCHDAGGSGDCQSGGDIVLKNENNSCCHCVPGKK